MPSTLRSAFRTCSTDVVRRTRTFVNTMPLSAKEADLPNKPLSVVYNSITREATIKFQLSQNATGDAVIDPSHVVFSFTGKDAAGRDMDVTANKMDGFTITPF